MEFPKVRRSIRSKVSAGREMTKMLFDRPDWEKSILSELPFGPDASTAYLTELQKASVYLEFGSGSSTIVASGSSIERLVSVESDADFLRAVSHRIYNSGTPIPQVDLLQANIGATGPWGVPLLKARAWGSRRKWPRYSTAPWSDFGPDFAADLILIDGRFRVACALAVVTNQASSKWTMLVDDFDERSEYQPITAFAQLKEMRGRMAVFSPKSSIDLLEARNALEFFQSDWR